MSQTSVVPEHNDGQKKYKRTPSQQHRKADQTSHASHFEPKCADQEQDKSVDTLIRQAAKPGATREAAKLGQVLVYLIELAEKGMPVCTKSESGIAHMVVESSSGD